MDLLDDIERERLRVFTLGALGVGVMYYVATSRVLDAVLMGLCIGLLGSGAAVAKRLTSPEGWAAVQARAARDAAPPPRRWQVWLRNLLPFGLAVCASVAWLATLQRTVPGP